METRPTSIATSTTTTSPSPPRRSHPPRTRSSTIPSRASTPSAHRALPRSSARDFHTPNSWQANRAQNGVQVYYYLGKFHDHLAAAPIGFTRAAGNFEAVDGDAIQANTDDGANLANGLPDFFHTDNANMETPPDGIPPRMQMYLFRDPADNTDPFL